MNRVITNEPARDFIEQRRDGDIIVLRNPRTNAQVTLPKSASSHEKRLAIKQLQEPVVDPFAGVRANEAMDRMAGAKPTPAVSDPEPLRLAPGVGTSNSPYRLRQEKLHAEWKVRQDAKAARETELRTQDRLIDKLAERLQVKPAEQPTAATEDEIAANEWAARDAARDRYFDAVRDKRPFEEVQAAFAELKAFSEASQSHADVAERLAEKLEASE